APRRPPGRRYPPRPAPRCRAGPARGSPGRTVAPGRVGAVPRALGADPVLVGQEPAIGLLDAAAQVRLVAPAGRVQAAHVEELARRAVRLRPVVDDLARPARDLPHDPGELGDADVLAR